MDIGDVRFFFFLACGVADDTERSCFERPTDGGKQSASQST